MLFSGLWTDSETGVIDEAKKATFMKIADKHNRASIRSKRRVKLVTERFNPPDFFTTSITKSKDIPTILYEPGEGSYNLIDYMIIFLKEFTNKEYEYSDHKLITSEFVKYFNIEVKPLPNNMMLLFEDLEGNKYVYDKFWYHLCKFVLKENG